MELTEEQELAKEKIASYVDRPRSPYFSVTGFAGTGKSTLLAHILASGVISDRRVAVAAPTGRAAMILTKMGCDASTIHSLVYDPVEQPDGSMLYVRKDNLTADLILVDEAPMVAKPQHEDLMYFKVPVVYFGDSFQLEPVGEDPHILTRPDASLIEVHRQAKKSAIIRLATDTRSGNFRFGKKYQPSKRGSVEWGNFDDFVNAAGEVDQLICGFNKTRINVNESWRSAIGFRKIIEKDDRVICLRNNRKLGLFNGLCGTVTAVKERDKDYCVCSIKDEMGRLFPIVYMWTETIRTGTVPIKIPAAKYRPDLSHWTYSYALTGHKMQGGSVNTCAIYEETSSSWNPDRWRYTVQTRVVKNLLYCK